MSFFRKRKRPSRVRPEAEVQVKSTKKRKIFPAEVKLLAVEAMELGLSPDEVSEIVGAGTSTMVKWRKLYLEGGEKALIRQAAHPGTRRICGALERQIKQMRLDNPEAGVRRIRDELKRDQNIMVSAETVRRVVNDAGLGNPPIQKKRRPPAVRHFEKELPNTLWQIDIFTFKLKRMYQVYLVGIIDDHSRYIVGHGLFRQQTAEAVLEVVKGATGQWGAPREILSDNGRQFAAWRGQTQFQKVLQRQGIGHVRSAPHHPMTLGKIERFWKTIWTEFLDDSVFASFADARQRLDHWIGYYNHQRPHQGIDGACPADRFYGVADDVEEAIRQGCSENALQLALGQETRPPLYLLGKLGNTDVRVTRKGEDIEVKLGDSVHEVIRTGSTFGIDEAGKFYRQEATDEVEGFKRRGALPSGGDGAEEGGPDCGVVPDIWSEPPDLESRHGESGPGCEGSIGTEEPRQEGVIGGAIADCRYEEREAVVGEGPGNMETEVRDRDDVRGYPPQAFERGAASGRSGGGKKKEQKSSPPETEEELETRWSVTDRNIDGE
jgi:transposase InsO family protein